MRRLAPFTAALAFAACSPNVQQAAPDATVAPVVDTTDAGPEPIDAACPDVHFSPTAVTPSIALVIDQSGSMASAFGTTTRYAAVRSALTDATTGVVTELQAKAYFGATLFTSGSTCPALQKIGRALNNRDAIDTLIGDNSPGENTPTGGAITAVIAQFAATPPPAGSPPYIVLATDGIPNTCADGDDTTDGQTQAIAAAKAAYAAGIKLFILSVGPDTSAANLQAMANAGVGAPTGTNAPYFSGSSPAALKTAFDTVIGGVLSCNLAINGTVDPSAAMSGTVTLDGTTLVYGTDWTVVNGTTIQLLGNACTTLENTATPVVDASFPCGVVIE